MTYLFFSILLLLLPIIGAVDASNYGIVGTWTSGTSNPYTTLTNTIDFSSIDTTIISNVTFCGSFVVPSVSGFYSLKTISNTAITLPIFAINGQSVPNGEFVYLYQNRVYNLVLTVDFIKTVTTTSTLMLTITAQGSGAQLLTFYNGTCYNPQFHLILDELTTAVLPNAAYGLIRLTQNYTGPLIQVSGDGNSNASLLFQDIGYDETTMSLDVLSVLNFSQFVVGGDVYVTILYDQSLGSNDMTTSNTSALPLLKLSDWNTSSSSYPLLSIIQDNIDIDNMFNTSLHTSDASINVVWQLNGSASYSTTNAPLSNISLLSNNDDASDNNLNFPILQIASFINNTFNGLSPFSPFAISVDSFSNIYIADVANNLAIRYSYNPYIAPTLFGQYFTNQPFGVGVDSYGNVLISDTYNDRILVYFPNQTLKAIVSNDNPSLSNANELWVDSQNNIYAADDQIFKFWANYSFAQVFDAAISATGVTVDEQGNIYYANGQQENVIKLSPDGSTVLLSINSSIIPYLSGPWDVCLDSMGNVYVAASNNDSIIVLNPDDFSLNYVLDNLGLSAPRSVYIDPTTQFLMIADTGNGRILTVDQTSGEILSIIIIPTGPVYAISPGLLFPNPNSSSSLSSATALFSQNLVNYQNASSVPVILNETMVTVMSWTIDTDNSLSPPTWNTIVSPSMNIGPFTMSYGQVISFPTELSLIDQSLLQNYSYKVWVLHHPNNITDYVPLTFYQPPTPPPPGPSSSSSTSNTMLILEIVLPIIIFLLLVVLLMWRYNNNNNNNNHSGRRQNMLRGDHYRSTSSRPF